MKDEQGARERMNGTQTCTESGSELTRGSSASVPTRYEVVDKDGRTWGPYETAQGAAEIAKAMFPGQEQDEERSGKGWDVQVVGADRPPQTWIAAKREIDEGWER